MTQPEHKKLRLVNGVVKPMLPAQDCDCRSDPEGQLPFIWHVTPAITRLVLFFAAAMSLGVGLSAGFTMNSSGHPDTAMASAIASLFLVFAETASAYMYKQAPPPLALACTLKEPPHLDINFVDQLNKLHAW